MSGKSTRCDIARDVVRVAMGVGVVALADCIYRRRVRKMVGTVSAAFSRAIIESTVGGAR
jgi:hypothetical protein